MKTPDEMRRYKREWARKNFVPAPLHLGQALPGGMKVCGKCGALKSLPDFSRGRCKDGRHSYCKVCNVAAFKGWYVDNGDDFRASVRGLRARDPEGMRTKVNAQRRARRRDFPSETRRLDRKKFQRAKAARPELVAAQNARRRARQLSAPGRGVSVADWRVVFVNSFGLCAYCNEREPLTVDHIEPLSRGGAHDPDNLVAACARCNKSKGNRPLVVWLAKQRAA